MREWWRNAVIYQIYPRSFQDDNGDGIGDLPGITRRLDHVASLGVDAIWLSPIFTSPDKDMGYDVSDYIGVNPIFGTLADFDTLVARAHDLGLRVIIDQVLSHSSDQHPWFEESRQDRTNKMADWYVWADPKPDGSPPTNWLSVFGGSAWHFDPRRKQYYLHNFLVEQPDLNFHNPDVVDALEDAMRFWLDRGVDGFRLDTVNFYVHNHALVDNPPADWDEFPDNPYGAQKHLHSKTQPENLKVLERLRTLTDEYADRVMVGEIGEDEDRQIATMAEYTAGAKRLHMAYSFALLGDIHTAAWFRECVEGFFDAASDGWPCWSFSNHDVRRHVSRWTLKTGDEDAVAKQSVHLLCSFPGAICLYQGEELGQTETDIEFHELRDLGCIDFWPVNKGRDGCRTPMVWEANAPNAGFSTGTPWLPVKAPQAARAVDIAEAQEDGVLATYRAALAFRKSEPSLHSAAFEFLDLPEPVLALRRGEGETALVCVFNLSGEVQHLELKGTAQAVGPAHGEVTKNSLTLPPHGYVFLRGGSGSHGIKMTKQAAMA